MPEPARALQGKESQRLPLHRYDIRVYFEDTDAGGVVYHAAYLKFAERARTEMMRAFGKSHADMIAETGAIFTVRRCTIEFLRPARLDDLLRVETSISDMGAATMDLEQRFLRNGDEIARLDVQLACMNGNGRATRIPAIIRDALSEQRRRSRNPS